MSSLPEVSSVPYDATLKERVLEFMKVELIKRDTLMLSDRPSFNEGSPKKPQLKGKITTDEDQQSMS